MPTNDSRMVNRFSVNTSKNDSKPNTANTRKASRDEILPLVSIGDLPLHNDDAHRHFFPFSDWRFSSPVSYWDPQHYGYWASLVEFSCVLLASIFLYLRNAVLRPWVASILAIYLAYWMYVYIVWI